LFAYLELGRKLNLDPTKYGQAYNFGPNSSDALSVESMVKNALQFWEGGTYSIVSDTSNPHEAGLLKLDISKAIKDLSWRPVFNAQNAIERTINWYKSYYNDMPAVELMKIDIEYYKNLING
jgi:CDP-glucose 4,6-dehydratase